MSDIGVLGAGQMGKGISKNLLNAGNKIMIYTRYTNEKLKEDKKLIELETLGAKFVRDIGELFKNNEILITCLPNAPVIEELLIGERGLYNYKDSTIKLVIDFSTTIPESTVRISNMLKKKKIDMIDAPMGGGPKQAEEGSIMLAVGGEREVFNKYFAVLKAVAGEIVYIGKSGTGHAIKLINNFLGILNQTTTSAAYLLCDKIGIKNKALFNFISVSGADSKGFQFQSQKIFEGTFPTNFQLDFAVKDLEYANELFNSQGFYFEIMEDILKLFKQAQAAGYDKRDVGTIHFYLGSHNMK